MHVIITILCYCGMITLFRSIYVNEHTLFKVKVEFHEAAAVRILRIFISMIFASLTAEHKNEEGTRGRTAVVSYLGFPRS